MSSDRYMIYLNNQRKYFLFNFTKMCLFQLKYSQEIASSEISLINIFIIKQFPNQTAVITFIPPSRQQTSFILPGIKKTRSFLNFKIGTCNSQTSAASSVIAAARSAAGAERARGMTAGLAGDASATRVGERLR